MVNNKKEEICRLHVDTIDDTLVELFIDFEKYYESYEKKDESEMDLAIERLKDQIYRIDNIYNASLKMGAPKVISEFEKEMLKSQIEGFIDAMREREDPEILREDVRAMDLMWKSMMLNKYCECLKKLEKEEK
jgi:hypothetical protein